MMDFSQNSTSLSEELGKMNPNMDMLSYITSLVGINTCDGDVENGVSTDTQERSNLGELIPNSFNPCDGVINP